ncbi:MAG TPA: GGDEF domain-containing protein [Nocardioides sp.]|nr:GGDEF domain-containing protein [Nocardioides sp.]
MLDTLTLRVAFGLVAVCVLVLFYGVTYRSTRSAYSGWWCVSLAAFVTSATLFLLNHTPGQALGTSLGNSIAVLGTACVWAAARSLRTQAPPLHRLALVPLVVLAVTLMDHPQEDIWAGGTAYLLGMAVLLGLSSREMVMLLQSQRNSLDTRPQYRFTVVSLAVASGAVALFYLLRGIVFVATGPDSRLFVVGFGSAVTTITTMLLLIVVTFSMSALSHEQQTSELRVQATRDGLTGALNRAEFLRVVQRRIDIAATPTTALVVADLDHFKALNDGHGHAAGDRALFAFADACRSVIGGEGVVGRLGGDEFVLLTDVAAESVVAEVARRYDQRSTDGGALPSVSFGIVAARPGDDARALITLADIALYQAKAAGRGCAVRYDGHVPTVANEFRLA